MLYVGIGIAGLILLTGGGLYGYREYLRSKPAPVWMPITLKADISMADQKALAEEIAEKLNNDDLLRQIVIDADLQKGFKQPSEEAAIKELKGRLFSKAGTADTANGPMPSVNVGLSGTGGESEVLFRASKRIMKDVWRMMGIDSETGKPLQDPGMMPSFDGP